MDEHRQYESLPEEGLKEFWRCKWDERVIVIALAYLRMIIQWGNMKNRFVLVFIVLAIPFGARAEVFKSSLEAKLEMSEAHQSLDFRARRLKYGDPTKFYGLPFEGVQIVYSDDLKAVYLEAEVFSSSREKLKNYVSTHLLSFTPITPFADSSVDIMPNNPFTAAASLFAHCKHIKRDGGDFIKGVCVGSLILHVPNTLKADVDPEDSWAILFSIRK